MGKSFEARAIAGQRRANERARMFERNTARARKVNGHAVAARAFSITMKAGI